MGVLDVESSCRALLVLEDKPQGSVLASAPAPPRPPKRVTFIEPEFENPPGMPAAVPEASVRGGFAPRNLGSGMWRSCGVAQMHSQIRAGGITALLACSPARCFQRVTSTRTAMARYGPSASRVSYPCPGNVPVTCSQGQ